MYTFLEGTAGAIMTPEYLRLYAGTPVGDGLMVVRASGLDSDAMYTIYITDLSNHLLGAIELRTLLFSNEDILVETLMDPCVHSATILDDQRDAAVLVRKYDLMSLPVTDENGILVGAIDVNSIVDVIEEEDTEDFEKMAALVPSDDTYKNSSAWILAKHRIPWLMILMLSSVLCERIIRSYESMLLFSVIGGLVASCMPMMMDTGGNCGSQSSTTIIRALALGELTLADTGKILWKELSTGLLCGAGLSLIYCLVLLLFMGAVASHAIAISAALFITVVLSNVLGCLLPMLAHAIKLDPALMAGPLITTIVDACSLFILFAFASAIL